MAVQRILQKFDFWPKIPPPQGSKYLYERPKREYSDHAMNIFRKVHKMDRDTPLKTKIKQEIHRMETLKLFEKASQKGADIDTIDTTDIDSDEPDIIERRIKFEELKRRFENTKKYSLDVMKGNDYSFNMYLRKMQKLSNSNYGGIDVEGYQDYLNNLLEINKIKEDKIKERDHLYDEKLNIDYSGRKQNLTNPPTGRALPAMFDINELATVREKADRLNKMRETLINILKDEIEIRNRYDSEFGHAIEDK